jgi:hypothetical protein
MFYKVYRSLWQCAPDIYDLFSTAASSSELVLQNECFTGTGVVAAGGAIILGQEVTAAIVGQ